jgi:hypothetical protein
MGKKVTPTGSAGGLARAEKLTQEQRKQIARKAALSRWNQGIPKATHEGLLKIGDREIACAVLEGEIRVLSERETTKILGGKRGGSHWKRMKEKEGGADLPVYLSAKNLKAFIPSDLALAPIEYIPLNGGSVGHGMRADLLPEVLKVFRRAREAGALHPSQERIADEAEIILNALEKVSMIALVDEASGYQEVRARDALQVILDAFLRKSFAAWTKRFPDEFYKEIYRLRGWEWPGMAENRFQVVGKYTTDLIYKRLAPGLQEELDKKNPKNPKGHRESKNHQWLTEEIGHPALSAHMHAVLGLMRASRNWDQFKSLIDVAFPIQGSHVQIELGLPETTS